MDQRNQKLHAIFSTSGWSRFIETLRGYRNAGRILPASVTLSDTTVEERQRLASFLRQKSPGQGSRLRYDLASISQTLNRAELPSDWEDILEVVCGPVPLEAVASRASAKAWHDFWAAAHDVFACNPFPLSQEWITSLRRDGTLRRISNGDTVLAMHQLEVATRLLQALPLSEDQPLAHTAARYCGNSHALDPTYPLATLVLRSLALRQGRVLSSRAQDRRELWAEFGVVCDVLSAPALTFNLGLTGDDPLADLVALASSAIQPIHLTTKILWATLWKNLQCPERVFVCENPTIVSLAAVQLGRNCAPLICVEGEPKSASRLLLRALSKGGSVLFYHGDFDWPGLEIAERIFREFGAVPWQFDVQAYREASNFQGRPLIGRPARSSWCPELCESMQRAGVAYDEELLAAHLFRDLLNS